MKWTHAFCFAIIFGMLPLGWADDPLPPKGKPVTVKISLSKEDRARLLRAARGTEATFLVGLTGNVIVPREVFPLGIRVFLNKPEATAATSIDDPSYVMSSAFGHKQITASKFASYRFSDVENLAIGLRRLQINQEAESLTLTVVVIGLGADKSRLLLHEATILPEAK